MLKKELRTHYLKQRKSLSEADLENFSQRITLLLTRNFSFTGKKIHVYLPISKNKEINTRIFIDYLLSTAKCRIFTPKIWGEEMLQVELTKDSEFSENSFGGNEILNSKECTDEMDFIIFPLIYADKNGNRIGYGKGYYDRFFSKNSTKAIKIGLTIFEPNQEISDIEKHDIPLDYLVSPIEVLSFSKKSLK